MSGRPDYIRLNLGLVIIIKVQMNRASKPMSLKDKIDTYLPDTERFYEWLIR